MRRGGVPGSEYSQAESSPRPCPTLYILQDWTIPRKARELRELTPLITRKLAPDSTVFAVLTWRTSAPPRTIGRSHRMHNFRLNLIAVLNLVFPEEPTGRDIISVEVEHAAGRSR